MSFEEKSTWITGLSQLVVGVWYLFEILDKAATTPDADIEYRGELLVMIGASVALSAGSPAILVATCSGLE